MELAPAQSFHRLPHACQPFGFTLVESLISIVVVAVMLTTAINMVGSAARARRVQVAQAEAPALAVQLMTEILSTRYHDAANPTNWGPESDEPAGTRAYFDDVDDYDGWSASPPQSRSGAVIPGYTGWTEAVSVRWVNAADPSATAGSETGLKRITVTVTDDQGRTTQLVALRAQDRGSDSPSSGTNVPIGWVGLALQTAGAGTAIQSGVNLLNEPAGQPSSLALVNNHPPHAVASALPVSGTAPLLVSFTASGSTDPDTGDVLTYRWSFGDDTTAVGPAITHTYVTPGTYVAILTVTDRAGAVSTATLTVQVTTAAGPG